MIGLMKPLTTDQICARYAEKGAKLTLKPLPDAPDTVLFEGDALAFEFLGKLFLAHAKKQNGCGFQIGPKYGGRAFFTKKSKLNLYLHCLPCDSLPAHGRS